MHTYGTGMVRQIIGVEWPSTVEVTPVKEIQPERAPGERVHMPPPLMLCEVPESMCSARERLALAWAKRAPVKSATKSTGATKKARSRKNTKSKG